VTCDLRSRSRDAINVIIAFHWFTRFMFPLPFLVLQIVFFMLITEMASKFSYHARFLRNRQFCFASLVKFCNILWGYIKFVGGQYFMMVKSKVTILLL
jgi:hypothetical protein